MLAFFNLGPSEIIVLLVLGVVLYGRNLPDVGRKLGHTVANLRRSLNEFKRQLDSDESIREIRDTMKQTRQDMDNASRLPRAIADPRSAVKNLAKEAMGPLPEDRQTPPGAVAPVETGAVEEPTRPGEPARVDAADGAAPPVDQSKTTRDD